MSGLVLDDEQALVLGQLAAHHRLKADLLGVLVRAVDPVVTRTSGCQCSWMRSFPGEGALEPEREVVGEDFAEEAGPPKVPFRKTPKSSTRQAVSIPRRRRIACRISHGSSFMFARSGVVKSTPRPAN